MGKFFKHILCNISAAALALPLAFSAADLCAKPTQMEGWRLTFSLTDDLEKLQKLKRNFDQDGLNEKSLSQTGELQESVQTFLKLGFARDFALGNGLGMTAEVHTAFSPNMPDAAENVLGFDTPLSGLSDQHGFQMGGGVAFALGEGLNASVSFDSGKRGSEDEQRGLFRLKASW